MDHQQEQAKYEVKRNVFLPVDGSEHSDRAVDWYISNVWREGDCAVVFYAKCMPTIPVAPYPYGSIYVEEFNELMGKENNRAKQLLQGYGLRLKRSNVHFKLITETAMQVGEIIVKNVTDEQSSLIVMGSRGMGAVSRFILGSTSSYVVHESDVPIIVVPPSQLHQSDLHSD